MKKIKLTQGKVALVSDCKFERVNCFKWYAKKAACKWYAARHERTNGQRKTIYMHRFITNCPAGMEVDHDNRNSLDNQDENLIVCTKKENLQNRNWKSQLY